MLDRSKHVWVEPGGARRVDIRSMLREPHVQDQFARIDTMRQRLEEMASHEHAGQSDEWYTPPWVFQALDVTFDMDAASPGADTVPWIPATHHICHEGIATPWRGAVWLNPPYGRRNSIKPWLDKMARHGNGIALVPNRTGASWWQDSADEADALLFVRGKIRFLRPDGSEGVSPGYGNVLMAYGPEMADALMRSRMEGWRAYTASGLTGAP